MERTKTEVEDGSISLGFLLYRQGEFEKAKQFFECLLAENALYDFHKASLYEFAPLLKQYDVTMNRIRCYRGLGSVSSMLSQYDETLMNFQRELAILTKLNQHEAEVETASAYVAIGQIHFFKKELDLALSYEEKALAILLPLNHPVLAYVYTAKGDFDSGIQFYQKALELYGQHLPANHENIGVTYANMGIVYKENKKFKEALQCYEKTRETYLECLPSNHPRILILEQDISRARALMNIFVC
ncbi:unnamed protein product [Didymodactylos carnosus]|uniref:Tetratricopeptide repeat protein n=1 Tax=Didymodactylos carnosus TaxID=1234261 RepID=A0A815FLF1_9BILA|nr:unnamed protein product [Didymodactylos carnosus]CAF1342683.1 unnamed protein product [Didymodactylos carnosus]CAF4153695.1 unnamed protein product [Didymodactylos carnosus]CAF4165748.1 unnamed protein product [Didymodactylos carnosus]